MQITVNSGSGGFDSDKYRHLNSLRSEMDHSANSFLEEAKSDASGRLNSLTESDLASDPARISSEQSAIDELFGENLSELKAHLQKQFAGRLSPKEIDHYLDDFKAAWHEKFNVESHLDNLQSDRAPKLQSPHEMFQSVGSMKSPPPLGGAKKSSPPLGAATPPALPYPTPANLDQALRDANWWNMHPYVDGWASQWLSSDLQDEIQKLIISGGSMADLQQWISQTFPSTKDVYWQMTGGLSPQDAQYFFNSCGITDVPAPTAMDNSLATYQAWMANFNPTDPNRQVAIAAWQGIMKSFNSESDPAALKTWAISYFSTQDMYMQAPDGDQATIETFYKMIGIPCPITGPTYMDGIYKQIRDYLSTLKQPSPDASLTILFAQGIFALGSGATQKQLDDWISSTFGTDDVYMQCRGVDQTTVNKMYSIVGVAPPSGPTAMDNLYFQVLDWIGSSSVPTLAQSLKSYILGIGSNGTTAQLQTWFKNNCQQNGNDIYWNNLGISQVDVTKIYGWCGEGTPPTGPTPMDTAYQQVETWLGTHPGPPGLALAQSLEVLIKSKGSSGAIGDLQTWFKANCEQNGNDIYWNNLGIGQGDVNQIYQICQEGTPPSQPTVMDTAYAQVEAWLSMDPEQPGLGLAKSLESYIKSEGSSGTVAELQAWFKSNCAQNGNDIYWNNLGIVPGDVDQIYQICQEGTPPSQPTVMDTAYAQVEAWLGTHPGQPGLGLAESLEALIKSKGSSGTLADLQGWFKANCGQNGNDIYWNNLGIAQGDVNQIFQICQEGTPPSQPTVMDTAYAQVEAWLGTHPGQPGLALAESLEALIKSKGSSGTVAELQAWFKNNCEQNGDDIYWNNQGIAEADVIQIYKICQEGTAPTQPSVMDTAYTEVEAWLSTHPGQPGLALAQSLEALIKQKGSTGTIAELQAWFKTNCEQNGNDIYWNNLGISQGDVNQIYEICGEGTAPTAPTFMDTAYQQVEAWLGTHPGQPGLALAQSLESYIKGKGSTGTLAQLQDWFKANCAQNGNDIFWNNPGIASSDIAQIYKICQEGTPPTQPTVMDTAYAQVEAWLGTHPGQPGLTLAQSLESYIKGKGSSGTLAQLQDWFKDNCAQNGNDIYWNNPGIASSDIAQIFKICQEGTPPSQPTVMDTAYAQVEAWLGTHPGQPGLALAQSLEALIKSKGSTGTLAELQAWFKGNCGQNGNDIYWNNLGIAQPDVIEIYKICQEGTPPTKPTVMDTAYAQVEAWLGTHPGQPGLGLAESLESFIKGKGSTGTVAQLQGWFTSNCAQNGNDIYWNNQGIEQADVSQIYQICGEGTPPTGPNAMDTAYSNAISWAKGLDPADSSLGAQLLAAFQAVGSKGTMDQVRAKALAAYATQDIYMQNPDASDATIGGFYKYLGIGTPPARTANDNLYKTAFDWRAKNAAKGSSDYQLFSDLLTKIFQVGSTGSLAAVNNWAQSISNSGYAGYPGLSPAADSEFVELTGASDFSGINAQIQAELQALGLSLQNVLNLLHMPQPQSPVQWARFQRRCQQLISAMNQDESQCGNDLGKWLQFAAKYGLPGSTINQIKQAAQGRVEEIGEASSDQSALAVYAAIQNEIALLASQHGNREDLIAWAKTINFGNYPGLTQQEISNIKSLLGI